MILEFSSFGPLGTNVYLLGCPTTHSAVVIDAPLHANRWLLGRSKELGLSIEKLFLTHSHWDHIAEASLLKEKLKIPVYVHPEDAPNLREPGADHLPLFFPITGVEPDRFFQAGEELWIGNICCQVIHTPGHTPGGVCFYFPQEKVLISGDTLFRGTMGNITLPTANPSLMWKSLKELATLPRDVIVYPGHGESTTIGEEKWITQPI